jgi:protein-L-isoaspartate(D-aspartate) O-methyltransferase
MERQFFPQDLLEQQIVERGINSPRVLSVLKTVDRSAFVPENLKANAYEDRPLPIAEGQTISQPYIVAYMADSANIEPEDRVLEIGTGCGYQTAILSKLAKEVFTIEIRRELHEHAKKTLQSLNIRNVSFLRGNGYQGWAEMAPFDVIIVSAAAPIVPEKLIEQLKPGGRMVIPLGEDQQRLLKFTRVDSKIFEETLIPVRFVPMIQRLE